MAKKKVDVPASKGEFCPYVPPPGPELHPLLLKSRELLQKAVDATVANDAEELGKAAVQFFAVAIEMEEEFGEDFSIPDGFFDGFNQEARGVAFGGILLGCAKRLGLDIG